MPIYTFWFLPYLTTSSKFKNCKSGLEAKENITLKKKKWTTVINLLKFSHLIFHVIFFILGFLKICEKDLLAGFSQITGHVPEQIMSLHGHFLTLQSITAQRFAA